MKTLTEDEFVAKCNSDLSTSGIESVLDACEEYYGSGFTDASAGETECPTGHFYRVDRWIVQTDSLGFRELNTFDSEADAIKEFENLQAQYDAWCGVI